MTQTQAGTYLAVAGENHTTYKAELHNWTSSEYHAWWISRLKAVKSKRQSQPVQVD